MRLLGKWKNYYPISFSRFQIFPNNLLSKLIANLKGKAKQQNVFTYAKYCQLPRTLDRMSDERGKRLSLTIAIKIFNFIFLALNPKIIITNPAGFA